MSEENTAPARPFQNASNGQADPSANLGSAPVRRRGPGRPSKAEVAARTNGTDSNSAIPIPPGSSTPKAKPGRKPKKAVISDEQKSALGKQICGLHMIASVTFGIPELVIQPQEGELLANSLVAVAEEYGLSLAGKTGAAIQLIGTAAMIYLPRYFSLQNRVKAASQSQPLEPGQNGTANTSVN